MLKNSFTEIREKVFCMKQKQLTKEDILYLSHHCHQAGKESSMRDYLTQFIEDGYDLNCKERQMLSLAYGASVSKHRTSLRNMHALVHNYASDEHMISTTTQLKKVIEGQVVRLCTELLNLLKDKILPTCVTHEAKVYMLKIRADYERYMAEVSVSGEHSRWGEQSHNSYKASADLALCFLPPVHPTRLGLMLNFSVFYYDIYNSPERACILAKSTYDDAIEGGIFDKQKLETMDEDHSAAIEIMKCIRKNIIRWTGHMQGEPVDLD
jgi:14-3-3 protein epsilon